jgi:shikimate kinase
MPQHPVPLVLVGPMATGKTAVGRTLAARRGVPFVDTDRRIIERHGPIPGIFAAQGEAGFRRLEAAVVSEVLEAGGDAVVALGGGAVLDAGTRDTDLATVLPRILPDTGRPMLANNPADRWVELYEQRRPLYHEVADLVIDTRGRSVRTVLEQVLRRLDAEPAGGTQPPEESRTTSHGT